jgi:hypothetical protein
MQTEYRGLLVERGGPVSLGFELAAGPGGMTFHVRRVWLLGARVPLACAPSVEATATADEVGWLVRVAVSVPLLGRLAHYEGRLTPQ